MSEPKKHPWLGALVNAALVVLAFGLLGLVIWQNREKIREIFSRPLDLKLLALAVGGLLRRHDRHVCALVFPGPRDRADVQVSARPCFWV